MIHTARQGGRRPRIVVLGLRGFPGIPGGVEAHAEHLYPRLARKGFEVIVLSRAPYIKGKARDYEGVRLEPLLSPKNKHWETLAHTLWGVWVAAWRRPDILHIHGIGPAFFVPLARALGMRVVMTHHGPDYRRKKWGKAARVFLRAGEYLGVKTAHRVIAVSEFIAGGLRERFHRDIDHIPNGIEVHRPSAEEGWIRGLGLKKGEYILSVGRFVPEKGFDDLLAAFERADIGGAKLVFVGEAVHRDSYARAFEEKARRNPSVVLAGFLSGEPLRQVYENAKLFALPSYYEGLPLALLEALSYGVSCVASSIPAHEEIGLSSERYFGAGDVEGLSKTLSKFFHAKLEPCEEARQRENIAQRYAWDIVAQATQEVYEQLLSELKNGAAVSKREERAIFLPAGADSARGVCRQPRERNESRNTGLGTLSIFLFHEIFKDAREVDPRIICPHHGILISHFRQFVEYHLARGYKFVSPDQIIAGLEPARYVMATFDDSYASNLRVVPLLKEYGVPAVFFFSTYHVLNNEVFWWDALCRERASRGAGFPAICREIRSFKTQTVVEIRDALTRSFGTRALKPLGDIDRPLSPSELRSFAREPLVHIGNHTRHHSILTLLSAADMKKEIMGCQEDLGMLTGQRPSIIAYPNGNYDGKVLRAVQETGMKLGVTIELLKNDLPILSQSTHALRLGRFILSPARSIDAQCRKFESFARAYWRARNFVKKMSRWPAQRY